MSAEDLAKILVVDDDLTILMQVEEILRQSGYVPICVNNGAEALEKAEAEQPCLIVLDRRMPEMDGNEVLIMLKAEEATKNIPVIMLTGDTQMTDIATSLELGAVDYVVKPWDHDNFVARVKKALS